MWSSTDFSFVWMNKQDDSSGCNLKWVMKLMTFYLLLQLGDVESHCPRHESNKISLDDRWNSALQKAWMLTSPLFAHCHVCQILHWLHFSIYLT